MDRSDNLHEALELCLNSDIPAERLSAQIILQRLSKNDELQHIARENALLRKMLPYFRHLNYCSIHTSYRCDCGFLELEQAWETR